MSIVGLLAITWDVVPGTLATLRSTRRFDARDVVPNAQLDT